MKGFLLSLRSEFYKSRKTLGFWSAILLPLLICSLVTLGTYNRADSMAMLPPMALWLRYAGSILNIMGSLLLPMFIVFVAYSVNNVEHKADTWKTLFSLPISKWSVYSAKYFYAFSLVLISLALFALLTLGFGHLLQVLKPTLKFNEYAVSTLLLQIYLKLFLSSLGILSIQFLLSLLWADFLKPMGIGFVCTIAGVIASAAGWQYAYLFPYSHPMMAVLTLSPRHGNPMQIDVNVFHKEILVSLVVAAVVFIAGYFIVERKSVK